MHQRHLMPPFMGQGMCSGLRDAWNLAWKLDRVLAGTADATLLDTYQPERLPHVSDVIDISIFLGSIICIPDKAEAARRDEMFLSENAPPPAPFPKLTDGFLHRDKSGKVIAPAGELSPHGTVRHRGRTARFDSVVPPGLNLILTKEVTLTDLSEQSLAILASLKVTTVTVTDRRTATDAEIADTQEQILPFMQEKNLSAMLIRPDLYLFGGASDIAGLDSLLADLDEQTNTMGFARESVTRQMAFA